MKVIQLKEKFGLFSDHWSPKIIATVNDQLVKVAKVKGEFVWHHHNDEDELFLVIKGKLFIDLEDGVLELNEGDLVVVPKGKEHRPRTGSEEAWILLIEPGSTRHTGDVKDLLTNNNQETI